MGNNIKFQSFVFYITPQTQYSGVPTSKNIVNHFDLIADLISLKRLTGESIVDFKQRMMDVNVHPDSSTYDGVVNGITRALGYTRNKAITISLKLSSGGAPIARNPRVDILANKVVLYSDYRPDGTASIDKTIRIYQTSDTGYFLDDLVVAINTSECFSASIESDIRPNMHSTNLVRGNTDILIQGDPISTDSLTSLSAQYIVEGSLIFDETDIFKTLVTGTPNANGEYSIDRVNGKLYTYNVPQGNFAVSYHGSIFPFEVDYSPIKIYTFQDDNFQYELFRHETLDSEEEVNSLPNTEGSETYHQLYKETKTFWGE